MRRAFTPLRLTVAGLALLLVTLVLLITTSTDSFLLIPDEAHPLASLVDVPGGKDDSRGGIYYVDVLERKATVLERLFPGLRQGASLVRHEDITPPGVSDRQRVAADRLDMRLSQQVASAVALRALGYQVRIRVEGIRVSIVYGSTDAGGKLQAGDVIVGIDRKRVRTSTELRARIGRHNVGDVLHVTLLRNGRRRQTDVRLSRDRPSGRPILGILPQPALKVKVPFEIDFNLSNVGGPSAGLAFALQILEERGRNVDHGYRVAATGVIEPDGSVAAIGAVKQKTIGARRAHVDVFLVPAGDNYRDARKYAHGLRIIAVKNFQQALLSLATLPPKT